jgi:histidyl-tRNA synthetase
MPVLTSLSGYPEWLPEDQLVVEAFVAQLRRTFELYGFAPLETRAIEPLPVILAKGETDKEIYLLRRLQAGEEEANKAIGLHFDLTVPFARYVRENRGKLDFPFRRYQIQKAWRGERPSQGRYREFLQADFDIIDEAPLTVHSDLEVIQTVNEIVNELPIPQVNLLVNQRKLLEGFYRGLGIEAIADVLRVVDKLEKIGAEQVLRVLTQDLGLGEAAATKCIQLWQIKGQDVDEINQAVHALGVTHALLEEGLADLSTILSVCSRQPHNSVIADLSVARGLDYYTGMVIEGKFAQFPRYPTIVAGGRYDRLAADGASALPGVGLSIGVSRILGLVLHEGLLEASRKTPSCVLVALVSEERREQSAAVARVLRSRGIPSEVFPRPLKYGRQIAYAERKGIPFVWFPAESGEGSGEVRDLRSRAQSTADPLAWTPPPADREVQVTKNEDALQKLLESRKF